MMLWASILIAVLFLASPAGAFDTQKLDQTGTLFLQNIMPLIREATTLKSEVTQALKDTGQNEDEVVCLGRRFSSEWGCLAGVRVSPYTCKFAEDKWLEIRATVVLDEKEVESSALSREPCAEAVAETDLKWEWSTVSPTWMDH
jgi:hypothetical protein